jgi:hypothetical protein
MYFFVTSALRLAAILFYTYAVLLWNNLSFAHLIL